MLDDDRRTQIRENVSRLLREAREARGWSMNEMARRSKLSQQSISYVERGLRMPTLDTLLRMTSVLDLSLADVIREAMDRRKP